MFTKILATALLISGALTGLSAQASVIYTSRTSSIYAGSCNLGPCVEQSQSSSDFGPFSASFAPDPGNPNAYQVSQQSSLSENQISVSMSAYKQGTDRAGSSFTLDFNVDTPTNFSISGNLGYQYLASLAQINFTGTGPTLGLLDSNCTSSGNYQSCTYRNMPGWPPQYSVSTLAPGAYKLFVSATETGPDYLGSPSAAIANFTIKFAPVPLPAALWFLMAGLSGLRWAVRTGTIGRNVTEL